jgi:hypothetical protein
MVLCTVQSGGVSWAKDEAAGSRRKKDIRESKYGKETKGMLRATIHVLIFFMFDHPVINKFWNTLNTLTP